MKEGICGPISDCKWGSNSWICVFAEEGTNGNILRQVGGSAVVKCKGTMALPPEFIANSVTSSKAFIQQSDLICI